MKTIRDFAQEHEAEIKVIPGDKYLGNITGHGDEWRAEFVADYCPSDEEESGENEYVLVFSVFDDRSGSIKPSMWMEYRVEEVGCTDKHEMPIESIEAARRALSDLVFDWDMRKRTSSYCEEFLLKTFALKRVAFG